MDENYKREGFKKFLVVGIAKENWKRKVYENEFRSLLKEQKVEAISSWEELPDGVQISRETFDEFFSNQNIDAVLVIVEGGSSSEQTFVQGGTSYVGVGFYGFYASTAAVFYSPGYLSENTIVHMQANLFETTEGNLIWGGASESYEPKNTSDVIKAVSWKMVDEISRAGFIQ
jgi:hypothetical protein